MKNSFEHEGLRNQPWRPEQTGSSITSPEVQIALALLAYDEAHHTHSLYRPEEEHTPADTGPSSAMNEWIGGDPLHPNSYAVQYRSYVESHPHEYVDIHDPEALSKLLDALRRDVPRH
ncbi:MAG TPA: hypothetical protein VMV38_02405 [Candidatus Paceibacterota bacterium]|nr:hypothetical protein [Candidatus Paceibacterota bacterium]